MNHKYVYFTIVLLVPFFIATSGSTQPSPESRAPIITHAFAVGRGYYGDIWRIYIEAEDPEEDMLKIGLAVGQPGYGHYPTDWIYLSPQYRKHLKGYIQWNTFSSRTGYIHEWTQITLKVFILDKTGNESNVAVFPFVFESGIPDQYGYKLPAPFDQGEPSRLGYVMIDLIDPLALY